MDKNAWLCYILHNFILCNSSIIFSSENKCITSSLYACNNLYLSAPKFVGEINYIDEYVYQVNWTSYRKVTIKENQVRKFRYTAVLFSIKNFSCWIQFPIEICHVTCSLYILLYLIEHSESVRTKKHYRTQF